MLPESTGKDLITGGEPMNYLPGKMQGFFRPAVAISCPYRAEPMQLGEVLFRPPHGLSEWLGLVLTLEEKVRSWQSRSMGVFVFEQEISKLQNRTYPPLGDYPRLWPS